MKRNTYFKSVFAQHNEIYCVEISRPVQFKVLKLPTSLGVDSVLKESREYLGFLNEITNSIWFSDFDGTEYNFIPNEDVKVISINDRKARIEDKIFEFINSKNLSY